MFRPVIFWTHLALGVTGGGRPVASAITGAANFSFLILVLSGLVIWWPRRFTPAAWRLALVFNPTLRGKARDFNWHNSLGFWSALPLAAVVASGVFMSYQWPARWLDRVWGNAAERAAAAKPAPDRAAIERPANERGSPRNASRIAPAFMGNIAGMFRTVADEHPHWQSITITLPTLRDTLVQFAVAEGNTYRPDLKSQYWLSTTGIITRTTNYDSLSTARKVRSWYRFSHTGEVFGVAGQGLATLVSLAGTVLVYSGLSLATRRLIAFMRRRKRRATRSADAPQPA